MDNEPRSQSAQSRQGPAGGTSSFKEKCTRQVADWIEEKRYVCRHVRYIEQIEGSGELDGLLTTLGMTRQQLAASRISPLASMELSRRMIARVGRITEFPESQRLLAQQRCEACDNWKRCLRWLNHGERSDEYRRFCPNADLLDA
jgi:hypothetical protein